MVKTTGKLAVVAALLGLAGWAGVAGLGGSWWKSVGGGSSIEERVSAPPARACEVPLNRLGELVANKTSNVILRGSARVLKVLPDDNKGSRHQRFLLDAGNGRSLLVAHNIDLAPRVDGLAKGEIIEFCGEYEWNPKGGVIHWTHHDPGGRHPGGWLFYRGKIYR